MSNSTITRLRDTEGFTLIELLIVVVIIGILAAIAIPQFSSTKEKAFDAAAKSDIRNAMTAQEAYFADEQTYGSAANALGSGGSFTTSDGVNITTAASASGYAITAGHQSSGNTFFVEVGTGGTQAGKIQKQ